MDGYAEIYAVHNYSSCTTLHAVLTAKQVAKGLRSSKSK